MYYRGRTNYEVKSNVDESMVFAAVGEGFDFEVELKTLIVGDSIMIDGYSGVYKIISIGKEISHIQTSQGGATISSNSKVKVQKSVAYRG